MDADRRVRIEEMMKGISGALSIVVQELIDAGQDSDEVYDACIHAVHDLVSGWLMAKIEK